MATMSSLHTASVLRPCDVDTMAHSPLVDNAFDRQKGYSTLSPRSKEGSTRTLASVDSHSVPAARSHVQTSSLRQKTRRGSFVYDHPQRVRTTRSRDVLECPREKDPVPSSTAEQRSALAVVHNPLWGQFALLVLLMVTLGALAFTIVQLAGDPTASIPNALTTISVHSGDTLGSIASHYAPHADSAAVIERIQDLNELQSTVLLPGQVLVVPVGL